MRRHRFVYWFVLAAAVAAWQLAAQEAAVSFRAEEIARPQGTGSGWTTARDPDRLRREFAVAEHEWRDGRLEWRFTPRQGTRFNDLFRVIPLASPFTRIEVTLANPGAPFTLCAKVKDTSGAEWVASRHPLATSGQELTVVFEWRDWALASWTSRKTGPMVFPLTSFCLIAFDVEGDRDYHVQIRSVRVVTAVAEVTDVRGFAFPEQVDGDSEVAVAPFEVGVGAPLRDVRARLSLQRGQTEMASVELEAAPAEGGRLRLSAASPLRLSWLLRSGDYDLVLYVHGGFGKLEQVRVMQTLGKTHLRQVGGDGQGGVAEVRPHQGVPTLFIDGVPHTGMSAAAYGPSPDKFASFTLADVDLFTFCASPTEGHPGLSSLTWQAPDRYDYGQFEQRVAMVLGANRKAHIFPRLYLHAPAWWSERHPDDVVIAERPTGERYVFMHRGVRPAPSWASEAWRRDTAEGLRRLIRHIETSPYADNFIGYHLASGITEEWMMWGSNENEWVDYSPVNQAKFRAWLRERYGDDESLRRAWHSRAVSLETAEIPSYRKRAAAAFGSFRDPTAEQDVIDYYTYNSWLVADTITYFAKVVKDATRRRKTVGVFYGYLLQLGGGHRIHNAGHLALRQVLESPDIDFVCSPTSYAFRQFGGLGTTHFMSLVDSVRRHGKLWFDENDVRTSISPGKLGEWGKPADIAGDKVQQDKELACVLTNGVAQWWFDVGANRYDEPELRAVVKNLARVARDAQRLDRTSSFQAALVVDAASIPYMRVGDRLGSELLGDEVYSQIIRRRYYDAQPELSWLREKAYAFLKPKRIAHVAGCESEAVKLAMRWGEDPETAAEAGILHDITKKLNLDEQLILCGKYDIINDNLELKSPKLLHAKTGAALARDLFGVSDRVYEAIRWHTTGKPDMTMLEKIIYLADYIEPTRDFPGVEKLRELCYEDIDEAMALGLSMSLEDIRSYGEEPYKVTVEACEWYSRND